MKAIIPVSLLVKELKKLSPVVNKNTVIPILESVKMEFDKNILTLTASDLETTVLTKIACESRETFSVVVVLATLLDILQKLPDVPVMMDVSKKDVTLISDNDKFKIPKSGEVAEFPGIPEENFDFAFDADIDFIEALHNADQCKNPEDLMVTTNSACIDFKKDSISVVGTDAFILFKKEFKIKTGYKRQSLFRGKFISLIKGFRSAKISVGEKFVKADNGEMIVITRLQDAIYCQYDSILPQEITYNLEVDKRDFMAAINRVATTSSRTTRMLSINFESGSGEIKLKSQDIDYYMEGETRLRAKHEVEIEAIGVSAIQLLKILNTLDDETISIAITTPTKSIFLRNSQSNDVLCLLQPLMLN